MGKLIVSEFNPEILKHATLIKSSNGKKRLERFFDTYDLNNGKIMKVVRSYEELNSDLDGLSHKEIILYCYELFMSDLFGKLKRSEDKKLPYHVLPCEIQMSRDMVKSYTVPKVSPKHYVDVAKYLENTRFDVFTHIMILLSKRVKQSNKQGVFMPDLGNLSNIFINPETCCMRFIDYDGMQVDEFKTFCASTLITEDGIQIGMNERFYDPKTHLFKSNIDILSLYSLFLLYSTGTKLMNFDRTDYYYENGIIRLRESALREYTQTIGLAGTEFEEALFKLFFGENSDYPDEYIKKLVKNHTIVRCGKISKFSKKSF